MRHTLLIILLLFACTAFSQKENNIWYFGGKVGMNFNSGSPAIITDSKMDTREGCSSVADKNGNLLFYTDGITVWNSTHSVMDNGTGLKGNSSSTQSSVVVKKPGSEDIYYIFNPDCSETPTGGLHYSIVDISANGGLGKVITKNTVLKSGLLPERVIAIKSDAGCGFWIVTHDLSSSNFYSYLFTNTGINATPVISSTNVIHSTKDILGYLKASPDGKKIAACSYSTQRVELFDFDNSTGKVLNGGVIDSLYAVYGCSFSPNSNLLYVGSYQRLDLFQFDVSLSSIAAVKASKTLVYRKISGGVFGALQLGPDKKIYATKEGQSYLGIIEFPDIKGAGCAYKDSGIHAINGSSGKPRLGLPNFIDNPNPFAAELSLGKDKGFCKNSIFTLGPTNPTNGRYLWNTGDTLQNITGNQPGKYWLQAKISCGTDSVLLHDTVEVFAVSDTLPLSLGNDTMACAQSLLLSVNTIPNVKYLWSTGSDSVSTIASTTGSYWLKTTSACGTKSDTIKASLTGDSIPNIFLGNDTVLCASSSHILNTPFVNQAQYLWSTGAVTNTITVTTSGKYWVTVNNACQTKTDTIVLVFASTSPLSLGKDTVVCGTAYTITPTTTLQNNHYLWNTGDTTPTLTVTTNGTYKLTATNACDSKTDSVSVLFYTDISAINIGNDTLICTGQLTLSPTSLPGAKYQWSTGDTSRTITISQTGYYKVGVTTFCNNFFEDSIKISFYQSQPLKLADDYTACSETFTGLTLTPNYPYVNYLWNDGSTTPTITAKQEGLYILTVTDSCATYFTDTVYLSICDCGLYVPNAFTPNGDGINDAFLVGANCLPQKYTIKIYSRWGTLVYDGDNPLTGWDGTYNGKPVPEGVYFTIIDYKYANSHAKPFYTGSVTVLR